MLKISIGCVTYNRPHLLGEFIQSYLMQTYPLSHRELIILDDAGQYDNTSGNGWQLISIPRRFASLGEKRNACFALASPDTDILVITDDDDIYLPWWLETHARNFERGTKWSKAGWFYQSQDNRLIGKATQPGHPSYAYDKETFLNVGGYPPVSGWEDRDFHGKLDRASVLCSDALEEGERSYMIYRRFSTEKHLTGISLETYQDSNKFSPLLSHSEFEIGWRHNYIADIEEFEKTLSD